MKIIIKNIKELISAEETPALKVSGKDMSELQTLKNAWLKIEGDHIKDFGSMEEFPGIDDWSDIEVIDAWGKMVLPCWCDSHTHIVYAGSREEEFVDRINGLTYAEITNKGGGILNSAKKVQEASQDILIQSALSRLNEMIRMGTGAVEIKSGYGLTVEAELKMLRVVKKLKKLCPATIKATFLGAHAIPDEFKRNRKGYINKIIHEMLPVISSENLAEYIDVFCENGYYTPDETDMILKAGAEHGLKPKIHVNQFTAIGGVRVGIENKAISVDHLEIMNESDIEALKGVNTIATLLPACSFFLGIPYAPARRLIDEGLPVSLATDFNPGSTPSGNMCFVVSLGCIKMKLTPEEAINAATINSAYAMELSETHGSIARGKKANVFITKAMPSYAFLPYSYGSNNIETVIIGGKIFNNS